MCSGATLPTREREHAEVDIVGQLTATYRALCPTSIPEVGGDLGAVDVVLRRRFPGEPAAVFTTISDPARLRRWLGPVSGCRRARGGRDFAVGGGAEGRLLRREPSRLLEFTERTVSPVPVEALVTVRLAPDGPEHTIVELTRTIGAPEPGPGGDDHPLRGELDGDVAAAVLSGAASWDIAFLALDRHLNGAETTDPAAWRGSRPVQTFAQHALSAWVAAAGLDPATATGVVRDCLHHLAPDLTA